MSLQSDDTLQATQNPSEVVEVPNWIYIFK